MKLEYSKIAKGMNLLLATCTMSASLSVLPAFAGGQQDQQPNIVFIFSDDHANAAISAYNPGMVHTPNIDRIAEEGAIFDNTFVVNSICQPSRAAIMTAKHSHKNGVTDNSSRWNPNQVIYPKMMEEAGYQTALIGKWHMHPTPVNEFGYSKVLNGSGGQGTYYSPEFIDQRGKTEIIKGYSADIITDLSLNWLENQREEGKPFVLNIQYKAPHTPRRPPLRHLETFKNHNFPIPATLFDDYKTRGEHAENAWMQLYGMTAEGINAFPPAPDTPEKARIREEWLAKMNNGERFQFNAWMNRMSEEQRQAWHAAYDDINVQYWKQEQDPMYKRRWGNVPRDLKIARLEYMYQRFMRDYAATVLAIDENVGRVLDYLEENNLDKNTIVVYSSDQSFFIGEHGWAEKRYMYEEGMKMPFMIRWPEKIKAGMRPEAMIQNIDFGPTFLAAAGLDVDKGMQGISFLDVLTGKISDGEWEQKRPAVYYHYYAHGEHNVPRHDGVRSTRYKLIDFYSQNKGTGWYELYDLERDPDELNNVYTDARYGDVRHKMMDELEKARERYEVPGAVFEVPYPYMTRRERKELGL